ncbi:MAG: valine--tRNA ligase [Anaerolineae bacterium]
MNAQAPLPKEMPKIYDAGLIEQPLYEWWEQQGYFRPEIDPDREPFVISMPPPNVTGALHLGHAIMSSIEDALIRYHRLLGEPTLWVPGTDHAGIATQNVVERELAREGVTRHDLGREAFVQRAWEWKAIYHARITQQQRRLGISCDWERERFTMEDDLSRAVREAFVRLYERGLIYRGLYLVNWCPRCGTAVSDLEVEHTETDTHLWYVRYWTPDRSRSIVVATTRPETILGDTAVAVHPEDDRYQDLIGQEVVIPFVERVVPIIADDVVDSEFGTGAVKVTPAHDPVDYEIGRRHGLATVDVMTDEGTMSEAAGPFAGLNTLECREQIVASLEEAGDLVKTEPYHHSVGHCQRCDNVIEPRISTQWFVKAKPLAEPALQAVRDGRLRIVPERFTKVYTDWLEGIRDWCISRQLWWGHRIPVWYCDACGEMIIGREDPTVCPKCGSTELTQDPDVLDTWFSSALWPFSTLGWPEDTEDLRYFYPTSVMETGYDILFFWVARMVMMGLEMTGEVPFHTVYLHGLVRDRNGNKISKSLPDVEQYDPLLVIDEYGLDALRFTLLTGSTPGNDMKLAMERVESNRNFANKIWQAARFVLGNLSDEPDAYAPPEEPIDPNALDDPMDRWIVSRYHHLVEEVTRLFDAYQLGEAGRQLYEFIWGEYCDWYIEATKVRLRADNGEGTEAARRVLVYVLEGSLRLLHPFMPFVTEAIWQYLPHRGEALIVADWPRIGSRDEDAEQAADGLFELVRAIRNARAEYDVEPSRWIAAIVVAGERPAWLEDVHDVLSSLARVDPDRLTIAQDVATRPEKALTLVVGTFECYLPLADLVDLSRERERLWSEIADADLEIARSERLLSNENFVRKAPPEVVGREREKLAGHRERKQRLVERLATLEA